MSVTYTPTNSLAPWTDEKVDLLKRLVALGVTYRDIAETLGVTRNAAIGKAQRIQATSPNGRRPTSFYWTDEKLELLKELVSARATNQAMANQIGCSIWMVRRKLELLKWRKPPGRYTTEELRERKKRSKEKSAHRWEQNPYVKTDHFEPLPNTFPVDILEVTGCRWPVTKDTPFLFCNEPRFPNAVYCACHKQISEAPGDHTWN